jgi:actin-related protein 6
MQEETFVVNQMKEDVCFVSQNYTADTETSRCKPVDNPLLVEYMLPDFEATMRGTIRNREDMLRHMATDDGQSVKVHNERFSVPELLFSPADAGVQQCGVSECIASSMQALPPAVHPSLFANVNIVGGSGRFPGFKERLEREVRAAAPTAFTEVHTNMSPAPELQAWEGGVLLAQTAAFASKMRVTKAEWHEDGHELCKHRYLQAQAAFAEAV